MYELIPPLVLLAIGIILIAFEAFFLSFVTFWFGLAFIIVSGLTYLGLLPDSLWQYSSIAIISMVLLLSLRSTFVKMFLKPKNGERNDDFFDTEGKGVIVENGEKVYFKATYWNIDNDNDEFSDGEKVRVLGTKDGAAKIEKLISIKG